MTFQICDKDKQIKKVVISRSINNYRMPGSIQTRLDLPARKTRTSTRTPCKVVLDADNSEGSLERKGNAKLITTALPDPEALMRTPRSGRRNKGTPAKNDIQSSPLKRSASLKVVDAAMGEAVSPTKQARTPAKTPIRKKENVKPRIAESPCTSLAKLALNSPAVKPLGEKKISNSASPAKRGLLLSPPKLTFDNISDLLSSPVKTKTPLVGGKTTVRESLNPSPKSKLFPSKSPKQISSDLLEDLLCSPVQPKSRRTPAKSPRAVARNLLESPVKSKDFKVPTPARKSILPTPTKSLFPTASPRKITYNQLEDLLCSPVKPKSPAVFQTLVSRSPRKPVTPSKLLKTPTKNSGGLFSPPKPSSPSLTPSLHLADVSQLQNARAALHTGTPSHLLCREKEVGTMSTWLDSHLGKSKPGSMYVSGAPGTGKTATLTHLLNSKNFKYKSVFINCMVLKSSVAIYREVAKQLNPKTIPKTEKDSLKVIEAAIISGKEMILLVLDEVDQLESKDQAVLYTIFEWPALQGSKLALVGIANSLDLTERILPRLQVKEAYKPTLLHYPPYTKQQIIEILTARLAEGSKANESSTPVITTRAIAFLAGKISSLSGDLRKALDVCRRALELAETMARKQTLLKPMTPRGLASPSKSPHKGYKIPKALPLIGVVDMPQIMKVISTVYGSQVTQSLGTKGAGLPTQQKILIASLLLMVKKGHSKEVTLGKLIDTYNKVLRKRQMMPEIESSCVGMIEMLESRGMVSYVCKGAPRQGKVNLRLDEGEVGQAFGDKAMLAGIVEDTSCIVK